MITFKSDVVAEEDNAVLTVGENKLDCHVARNAETGDLTVSISDELPDDGTNIELLLTKCGSRYDGYLKTVDGRTTLTK